jgi:hypothetical protein
MEIELSECLARQRLVVTFSGWRIALSIFVIFLNFDGTFGMYNQAC